MKTPIIVAGAAAALLIAGGAGYAIAETSGGDDAHISPVTATPSPDGGATDGADESTSVDQPAEGRIDLGDDADDRDALTGETLQKAAEAALAETGGGTVTDAEEADAGDRHAYEVEVTLADGTDVDIDLDESFAVVDVDRD